VFRVQKNFLCLSEKDFATEGISKGKIFNLMSNRLKAMRIVFPNWRQNLFAAKSL
jgi:hypothetical protein